MSHRGPGIISKCNVSAIVFVEPRDEPVRALAEDVFTLRKVYQKFGCAFSFQELSKISETVCNVLQRSAGEKK